MFAKYHLVRRAVHYPAREVDLGVVPLGLDLAEYTRAILAYGAHERFSVTTLAEVRYEGRRHPILQVSEARAGGSRGSAPSPARKRVLVLSGVHGNEHAGLLAIPPILDHVARSAGQEQARLCVVTPVNPVGAAHLSRYNGDGYDINRDFVRFHTVEARAVRRAIAAERPDFIVSLHEGPQDATFLFTNRHVPDALTARLLKAMVGQGTELATKDYFGRTLAPPGHAPMGRGSYALSWAWARALHMMPASFYADQLGIPEITIESSWRMPRREDRVGPHVALVCALLAELS